MKILTGKLLMGALVLLGVSYALATTVGEGNGFVGFWCLIASMTTGLGGAIMGFLAIGYELSEEA